MRECPRFSVATSTPVPDLCMLRPTRMHPPMPIKCPKVTSISSEPESNLCPGGRTCSSISTNSSTNLIISDQASCSTFPKNRPSTTQVRFLNYTLVSFSNQELQSSTSASQTSEGKADTSIARDPAGKTRTMLPCDNHPSYYSCDNRPSYIIFL